MKYLVFGITFLLAGCSAPPLTDSQVKAVAKSCEANGMVLKVTTDYRYNTAFCVEVKK